MRRLLRFGCATVIVLVVIVGVIAALGPKPQQVGQPQAAGEATAPPEQPTANTVSEPAPLSYEVVTNEIIEAPNGRTRVRREIVIPEAGPPEGVAAALADAVRQGFAGHPNAIVSIVFGYGPDDDVGSGFTRGRASASRDGKGLDAGSARLLAGPDTGQIEIEVVTESYNGMPTETEFVYLPLT